MFHYFYHKECRVHGKSPITQVGPYQHQWRLTTRTRFVYFRKRLILEDPHWKRTPRTGQLLLHLGPFIWCLESLFSPNPKPSHRQYVLKVCVQSHDTLPGWGLITGVRVEGVHCMMFSSVSGFFLPTKSVTPVLSHNNQKCLQTLLNVPLGRRGGLTPDEKHQSKWQSFLLLLLPFPVLVVLQFELKTLNLLVRCSTLEPHLQP
jgi:hypothetical protein